MGKGEYINVYCSSVCTSNNFETTKRGLVRYI